MPEINLVPVLAAAIINMVIGALWYSPLLFVRTWMDLVAKRQPETQMPGPAYALSFIGALLMAYALALFLRFSNTDSIPVGAGLGFLAWLGFVATTSGVNDLFEGRALKLYLINAGYPLVSLVIMGALLAAWR